MIKRYLVMYDPQQGEQQIKLFSCLSAIGDWAWKNKVDCNNVEVMEITGTRVDTTEINLWNW